MNILCLSFSTLKKRITQHGPWNSQKSVD